MTIRSRTMGNALTPLASMVGPGDIEIATQAEVDAGTDATKAITADTLANTSLPIGGGGVVWTRVTETTASRTAAASEFILINAATCVITLPAAADNRRVAVKVITATITDIQIKTAGAGVDIDGTDHSSSGLVLSTQYEAIALISDGSDWWIY